MPMLAEKKQKAKYVLNPRGSAWAKDENKFGQKLLEKMGWKPGTGLGAQKQGITDIVRIPFKNNFKGIGCKETDESWSKQQADFDQVLAQLAGSNPDDANSSTKSSLEEKSKKSKARVHYHKFIRGKDVSKYSLKDLNCITGIDAISKETTQEEKGSGENNMYSYFESKMNKSEEENYDVHAEESSEGKDYSGRTESNCILGENFMEPEQCNSENNEVENEESLVKKNHKSVRFSETNMVHYRYIESCLEIKDETLDKAGVFKTSKKNKKNKKRKIENIYVNAAFDESVSGNFDEFNHEISPNKKKKRKSRNETLNELEQIGDSNETTLNQNELSIKSKKKKKDIIAKDQRKSRKCKNVSLSTLVESYTEKDNENGESSINDRLHEAAGETNSSSEIKGRKERRSSNRLLNAAKLKAAMEETENCIDNELSSRKSRKKRGTKSEDSEVVNDVQGNTEEDLNVVTGIVKKNGKKERKTS